MKKNEKYLTSDEKEDIKQAFELFVDDSTGKINPKEISEAMKCLGFETKNPSIYEFVNELDSRGHEDGVNFEQFIDAINSKLSEKETKEGMRKIFDLFIDNPQKNTITATSLHKIINELGDEMPLDEVNEMIKIVAKNRTEITFDEFFLIMTKTSFP